MGLSDRDWYREEPSPRWSIADKRFGRVSVYVPIGQTPRHALTVALAQRGYQVVR